MDEAEARALLARAREEVAEQLRDLGASFDDIVEASRDSNADDEHDVEGVTIAATRSQVSALIASARAAGTTWAPSCRCPTCGASPSATSTPAAATPARRSSTAITATVETANIASLSMVVPPGCIVFAAWK